jgi:flagellar biosynthesis component FlhA
VAGGDVTEVGKFSLQEMVVPIGLLLVVGCMLVPLPPLVLDILLCGNLLFALLLVIGALHIREPLKLATLPSLLLMATLVRLSLNLATTRAVLSTGHAGKAVEAFGSVVIQGSLVVGFVLFLLITLIQFIVVAKGAERVAEVSARFTLDALPGKQMAIDAEIRGGFLDPEGARKKRAEVQSESRFYGALDGSMKFVKGDALAGLVMTFVNIAGGLLVGLLIHNLEFDVALHRYTLLTVGDGLLSQIPSLLNSVAAGLVVTRVQVQESSSLSGDLISQLGEFRAARAFVAFAAFALGCVPGMPHIPLLGVSVVLIVTLLARHPRPEREDGGDGLREFEPILSPTLHLEVNREWFGAMPSLRRIAEELEELRGHAFSRWGIVLQRPGISVWESPRGAYRILLRGMEVASDRGGCERREWSDLISEARAVIDGYKDTLVDDGMTRRALDYVEKKVPDLVVGVVPAIISLTQLTTILRALLREGVTIGHLDVILQTVAESGGRMSERALVAEVRAALGPVVCATVAHEGTIQGIAVEPLLDLVLTKAEEGGSLIAGELVDAIWSRVGEVVRPGAVLLSSKRSRAYLRDLVRVRGEGIPVLAHEELSPRFEVVPVGAIELTEEVHRTALLNQAMEEGYEKKVA